MASLFTMGIMVVYGIFVISGFHAARITRVYVPLAVRNGSGPIELVCIYDIDDYENGLVVKWYHGNQQIYQWIPPMKPQDNGVIAGFTSYTIDTLNRPETHSIIRIKEANIDMSGGYTCVLVTFSSIAVSETKKMIVYVPENILTVQASNYNETHLNIECTSNGAYPLPVLSIIIESGIGKDGPIKIAENYGNNRSASLNTLMKKPLRPVLVECEIKIPETGYIRREKIVFYPTEEKK